ncbi:MAG: calcium-binding protein, partial [Pseudomonadota bacterium]
LPDFSGDESGTVLVDGVARDFRNQDGTTPAAWNEYVIIDLFHSQTIEDGDVAGLEDSFGEDYIAGGADHDVIFGQLGDDIIQGDGSIESAVGDEAVLDNRITNPQMGLDPVRAQREQDGSIDLTPTLSADRNIFTDAGFTPSFDADSDGDDYIEGNGGSDVIFGNLGQDDIVGDNSSLFTLDTRDERLPSGSDTLFGGSGTEINHDELVDNGVFDLDGDDPDFIIPADIHARDADVIAGDNANIYRVVGTGDITPPGEATIPGTGDTGGFLSFAYDDARIDGNGADLMNQSIIVRAVELLDYTPGGPDYDAAGAATDIGAADEIHGESGDDFIYGMRDADVLFGDSEDDDIIGGWGPDWISGGQGMDGIIGDDGRIYSGRYQAFEGAGNKSDADPTAVDDYAEILNGVLEVDELNKEIRTPGGIQQAIIHPTLVLDDLTVTGVGEIFKTVDLTPFNLTPPGQTDDPLFEPLYANDIIFGGLGNDFLHGSAGDDAISGAEALPDYFNAPVNPDDPDVVDDPLTEENEADDLLRFNPDKIEFADYDEETPRAELENFVLNFDPSGDPNGGETENDNFDEDQIFGDLGNDWLVGGPDNDNLFGGFGADLMDVDDDKSTLDHDGDGIPGDNFGPDPINIDIQDRAFGGAGRDVLIANTGGDRLIDWIGEFNSFIVPFAPFGEFTVTRAVPPQIFDFLYDLSEAVGADQTRATDVGLSIESIARNGEPDGELGLITQKDGQLWKDQTGAPIDPQPGNIPGGQRLTLRGVDFNDGTQQAFTADVGVWQVKQGRFEVSPETLGGNATAVFHVGEYLPNYYEALATISTAKPTKGFKANSYLLFDYVDPTDFKFAGVNISTDKLEMGHVDADGWHVDVQTPAQLKPNTDYDILLAVNGLTATLVVDNRDVLTHVFAARVDADGFTYGLNFGLVGLGAQNATARIDNVSVQILKPETTFEHNDDFTDGVADDFIPPVTGTWEVVNGRYQGTSVIGEDAALTTFDLNIGPNASLELEGTFSTDTLGGFFFDYYGESDYKFAGILADSNEVVIGHLSSKTGDIKYDAVTDLSFAVGPDYDVRVGLKGPTVSVAVGVEDGQGNIIYHEILGHVFNAVTVDGSFGLLSMGGQTAFDEVRLSTDDDTFLEPSDPLLAATAGTGSSQVLQTGALDPLAAEAIARLTSTYGFSDEEQARLAGVTFSVTDLQGLMLAQTRGSSVEIDVDAAGHGWFVDPTPMDDAEFRRHIPGTGLAATPDSDAYDRIDLLSVIMHELGHVLDLSHESGQPFMADTLTDGQRLDTLPADSIPVAEEAVGHDDHQVVSPKPATAAKGAIAHARQVVSSTPATEHADVRIFNEMFDAFIDVDESSLLQQANVLNNSYEIDDDFMIVDHDDKDEDVSNESVSESPDGGSDADDEGMVPEAVSAANVTGKGGLGKGMIDWTAKSSLVDRVTDLLD